MIIIAFNNSQRICHVQLRMIKLREISILRTDIATNTFSSLYPTQTF